MSHFTLPEGFTDLEREKVKKCALKKMATQFQTWKKRLWADYVNAEKKTPEFTGPLEKIKDHWDLFVQFKELEAAQERSRINKINADKKKFHHVLGPGGYKTSLPKWEESEAKLIAAGVTPKTVGWLDRCRTWFYAHGGSWTQSQGRLLNIQVLKKPRTL